eukprot:scaffold75274_cov64-Phaeocystis_antarctica.AAC.3
MRAAWRTESSGGRSWLREYCSWASSSGDMPARSTSKAQTWPRACTPASVLLAASTRTGWPSTRSRAGRSATSRTSAHPRYGVPS